MTHLRVLSIAAGGALALALAVAGGFGEQPDPVTGGSGMVLADVYLHGPRGDNN
jgi:hypothetical protein